MPRLGGWRRAAVFGLIVLVGANLRSVLLAVPPVLPLVQRDLTLSYTATGLLTSLPMLIFAAAAWPSGMLVGRLGGRTMVAAGLALLAVGAVLRAVWTEPLALYAFTL